MAPNTATVRRSDRAGTGLGTATQAGQCPCTAQHEEVNPKQLEKKKDLCRALMSPPPSSCTE
jgi:hypothetical protein